MQARFRILTRAAGELAWQDFGILPQYNEHQALWWQRHLLSKNGDMEVRLERVVPPMKRAYSKRTKGLAGRGR